MCVLLEQLLLGFSWVLCFYAPQMVRTTTEQRKCTQAYAGEPITSMGWLRRNTGEGWLTSNLAAAWPLKKRPLLSQHTALPLGNLDDHPSWGCCGDCILSLTSTKRWCYWVQSCEGLCEWSKPHLFQDDNGHAMLGGQNSLTANWVLTGADYGRGWFDEKIFTAPWGPWDVCLLAITFHGEENTDTRKNGV